MKLLYTCFLLFITILTHSQNFKVEITSGNQDNIISSYFDRQHNELIALDKSGFVVCWNVNNFSIINKFQLAPESISASTKKEGLGKYEIRTWDSVISITYPFNFSNYNNGERVVDLYNCKTGSFISQTPLGKISSIIYVKGLPITATASTIKQGSVEVMKEAQLVKTLPNNKNASINLDAIPTVLEADEKNKRLAIAYQNGRLEIRDLETLQLIQTFHDFEQEQEKKINQLLFIPASDNIAYAAGQSGLIIVRNIKSGALTDSMQLDQADYRLAVSPSGKYLTALHSNFYYLFWRDLQKKTTELKRIVDNKKVLGMFLSEVFFLSDNMLIGTGRNSLATNEIKVNGMGNTGAWLGLIEPKTNMASANLNITTASSWIQQYGTQMLKPSSLATVLHGFSDDYAYSDPSKLITRSGNLSTLSEQLSEFIEAQEHRKVHTSIQETVGSHSAPDFAEAGIVAAIFNIKPATFSDNTDTFRVAYYNIVTDSIFKTTKLVLPVKDAPYYHLLGTLHNQGLNFFEHTFKNTAQSRQTELVVFDAEGKKVMSDSLVNTFSYNTLSISQDQNYFTYQPEPGKLIVRSLKDMSIVQTINTGFNKYYYDLTGYAYPRFLKGKPSTLLHETYQTLNNNKQFCLLSTNVVTKETDTVITFPIRPISYETDSTATKLTLVYNYDFTDTVFVNTEAVQRAALQSFKPLFKPTVLLYDVKSKDFAGSFHTGQAGVSAASLNGNWLTVLQNDGQLLYFNLNNKNSRIAHLLDGDAQAIVTDSFYYTSPGLLPLIKLKTTEGSFTALQADVFLNRPHDILRQFDPYNTNTIKPYELAYNKRLAQGAVTRQQLNSLFKSYDKTTISGGEQEYIFTTKRQVDLPFNIINNANIGKLALFLNGQHLFGKTGIDVKKVIEQKKIPLQLSLGDNYISLIAETTTGIQLDPVKYYYYYEPKTFPRSKLYFFSAGVSKYQDSTHNLKYAAKDAGDIIEAFRYKAADTLISEVLLNGDVTKQNIAAWEKQIAKAGVDDVVILYFAGHGLLDEKNDFYFGVHDIDFRQPQKNGLSYQSILDLLEKSPSRKKILLLDACHSGSFDKSFIPQMLPTASGNNVRIVNNENRGVTIREKPQFTERQAFILMNQVFTDLSNDLGIDVIAASLGNSYALEKEDLKNGLFTYAMIRAVALSRAAGDGDETKMITMEQVKRYVEKEVKRLSNGDQVPSIRSSNVQSGMIEFYYPSKNYGDKTYQKFLEMYK